MLEKKQIEKYKKQGAIVIRSIFNEWIDYTGEVRSVRYRVPNKNQCK